MKSFSLASGSSGNCNYIESQSGFKVLIDVGLSYVKTEEILSSKGIDIKDINAICITHEHGDHVSGLKTIASRLECPIYLSKGTFEEVSSIKVSERDKKKWIIVKHHSNFKIGDINVLVVEKPHDAKEAVSFVFDDKDKKLGIFTDLGHITDEIKHIMKNLDVVYIEANYCNNHIKKNKDKFSQSYLNRLVSDVGHLGIHQTIDALIETAHDMQKIVLSHISENTNSYENAYVNVRDALREVDKLPEILVGFQGEPTDWIE